VEIMSRENSGFSFVCGVLLGGALGAILSVLFLPKSGKPVRRIIMKTARAWSHRAWQWRNKTSEVNANNHQPSRKGLKTSARKKVVANKVKIRK
jgi:gas vesicle protein